MELLPAQNLIKGVIMHVFGYIRITIPKTIVQRP